MSARKRPALKLVGRSDDPQAKLRKRQDLLLSRAYYLSGLIHDCFTAAWTATNPKAKAMWQQRAATRMAKLETMTAELQSIEAELRTRAPS